MNENIKKLLDSEVIIKRKAAKHMLDIFGTEEQLDMAVDIFRIRYQLWSKPSYADRDPYDDVRLQAEYASNQCLRTVFGNRIQDDVISKLLAFDRLSDHIRTLKEFLDNDTALLISDRYTIGEDDHDYIIIGHLIKNKDGIHPEFWALADEWQGIGYGMCVDPSEEKRRKAFDYWKSKDMLDVICRLCKN